MPLLKDATEVVVAVPAEAVSSWPVRVTDRDGSPDPALLAEDAPTTVAATVGDGVPAVAEAALPTAVMLIALDGRPAVLVTVPPTGAKPAGAAPEPPKVPARRARDPHQVRLRNHLRFSATCAILIPVVVAVVALFTEDGPARVLLTWLIALLAGAAVFASAASGNPTRRRAR